MRCSPASNRLRTSQVFRGLVYGKRKSVRKSKRNDRIFCAMIRPKQFVIENKRATRERDNSDILNLWRFLFRIESRDSPILTWSFLSAQNVKQATSKGVTADFCADVDLTDNIAVFVELQYPVLVPLT